MQRITISLDDELLASLDGMCAATGYASRSEAMRDILRMVIPSASKPVADISGGAADNRATCFAALSYVYDHHTRDLARRLTDNHHDHRTLSVATTHVHVDPESCLEVAILHGPQAEIEHFSRSVISQRGVRHGNLSLIPQTS